MAGQTIPSPLNSIIKDFDLLSIEPCIDNLRSLWKENRPDQKCSCYVDIHVRLIIKDEAGNKRHSKAMIISTRLF